MINISNRIQCYAIIHHVVPTLTNRWNILAILSLFNFAITLTYQSIPPVLSLMIEDLQISHAQAGLVMSIYVLPSVLLAIPLSIFAPRLGIKRIGLTCLFLVIIGSILVVTGKSLSVLLSGRMLMGIGATALPIVGLQGVARTFLHHRLGLAMGIYSSAMPLSTIVCFFTFGAVGTLWGWRVVIWITIAINVLALILFFIYFKTPRQDPGISGDTQVSLFSPTLGIGKLAWALAVCWALFALAHISLQTFLPDLMYQGGFDLSIAGSITGIIMVWGVILGPFNGYLLDRTNYKELFLIISTVSAAILAYLLPGGLAYIIPLVILLGILTAPMAPAINAIVPSVVKAEMMPVAYSINFTFASIGMFVGPYIAGLLRDSTGSYNASFLMMTLVFLFATVIGIWLLLQGIKRSKLGSY